MTPRIYLDANVFILAFERQDPTSDVARAVLELVDARRAMAVISELLVAELLVHPLRHGDDKLAQAYGELLSAPEGFETRAVDRDVLIEAARLRAVGSKTKLPDAIHVATARLGQCKAFVTADAKIEVPDDLMPIGINALTLDKIHALA